MSEPVKKPINLPPGQREVERPPVHHVGEPPLFDAASWRLSIAGAVENAREWTWPEVLALPQRDLESDWHGEEGWSVRAVRWSGVPLEALLRDARPQPSARFVRFSDGALYDTSLPIEIALQSDVLLATKLSGELLSARHGAPLRLVVASKYAWKSVKWLRRIELVDSDVPGFWERRGWHNSADPWRAERLA